MKRGILKCHLVSAKKNPPKNEFSRSSPPLDQSLHVCNMYTDKHFVNSSPDNQHLFENRKRKNVRNFRTHTVSCLQACSEFLELAQTDGKRWHKMLQHEYEQKLKLQEALEQLAKDQNTLERQAKKCMHVGGSTETPGRVNPLMGQLQQKSSAFLVC